MALGNHEFNFGLNNLERARADASFPWLSANTVVSKGATIRPFDPYLVKSIAGVKVTVIGVTTAAVPSWEKPENYRGLTFRPAPAAVREAIEELRRTHRPDLVLVAAHTGLGPNPRTRQRPSSEETLGENAAADLAESASGIDAVVFGHTHRELQELSPNGVLLIQPRNWGMSLARIDFELERDGAGWKVRRKRGRLIRVTETVTADPEILRLAAPYHELAERYLDTAVLVSPVEMDGRGGRFQDTPIVDAIHEVQMHFAKADVSFTSLFRPQARIPKGPVTVRQIAGLYIYDNELYAVEGTGRTIKDALENAARYFLSCRDPRCDQGPLINRGIPGYNFDTAEGVEYEIDLTRPAGERIRNLRCRGQPLPPDRTLRIAVNSYRAAGSAGYGMFRDAKILWRSNEDIRSLIVEYFTERGQLRARADGNWRIVPLRAVETLMREPRREPASRKKR
jgi:2',3'-cyclic-nucleotide 2'-phosphodiesterase/3'-nucleotidase